RAAGAVDHLGAVRHGYRVAHLGDPAGLDEHVYRAEGTLTVEDVGSLDQGGALLLSLLPCPFALLRERERESQQRQRCNERREASNCSHGYTPHRRAGRSLYGCPSDADGQDSTRVCTPCERTAGGRLSTAGVDRRRPPAG